MDGNSSTNSTAQQQQQLSSMVVALCLASEQSLRRNIVLVHAQVLILAIGLISILVLVTIYCRNRIAIHGNLLILFASIIAVSFLNSLGFFAANFKHSLLFWLYQDPCQLMTPLWMSALFLGPTYVYSIAYPALHFCVMIERVRATLLAEKYEGEGLRLGICMATGIWLISIAYLAFVASAAFADPSLTSTPQPFMSLSNKANSQPIFYVNLLLLLLVICTAFCDWRLTIANNRIRDASKTAATYSLSRNYQVNENVLTMRLIMPLDVIYAALYALYQILATIIRGNQPTLSTADYIFYFNLANTLLYVYSAMAIVVYIRFAKFVSRCRERTLEEARPPSEHGKIYFKQLETQWQ